MIQLSEQLRSALDTNSRVGIQHIIEVYSPIDYQTISNFEIAELNSSSPDYDPSRFDSAGNTVAIQLLLLDSGYKYHDFHSWEKDSYNTLNPKKLYRTMAIGEDDHEYYDEYASGIISASNNISASNPFVFNYRAVDLSEEYKTNGFTIEFGNDETIYPTDFEIVITNANGDIKKTITVKDNNKLLYTEIFDISDFYNAKITINKMNRDNVKCRISRIILGFSMFFDNDIISVSVKRSSHPISSEAPDISLSFTIWDSEDLFDPQNANGVFDLIQGNELVLDYLYYNGAKELIGTYSLDGKPSVTGKQATFNCKSGFWSILSSNNYLNETSAYFNATVENSGTELYRFSGGVVDKSNAGKAIIGYTTSSSQNQRNVFLISEDKNAVEMTSNAGNRGTVQLNSKKFYYNYSNSSVANTTIMSTTAINAGNRDGYGSMELIAREILIIYYNMCSLTEFANIKMPGMFVDYFSGKYETPTSVYITDDKTSTEVIQKYANAMFAMLLEDKKSRVTTKQIGGDEEGNTATFSSGDAIPLNQSLICGEITLDATTEYANDCNVNYYLYGEVNGYYDKNGTHAGDKGGETSNFVVDNNLVVAEFNTHHAQKINSLYNHWYKKSKVYTIPYMADPSIELGDFISFYDKYEHKHYGIVIENNYSSPLSTSDTIKVITVDNITV